MLGLVAGLLIIVSATLVMFGVTDPGGTVQASRRSRQPCGSSCLASTAQ